VPGRDPPLLLETADQAHHPIPISVDVPIAVEIPVLVGSARDSRPRIRRVGEYWGHADDPTEFLRAKGAPELPRNQLL
jgi:hypothetical protein